MATKNSLKTSRGPASPPYAHGPYEWNQICLNNKPSVDSSHRYVLAENFARKPAANDTIDDVWTAEAARNANINFELLGTNASDADVTFGTTIGGLQLQTDGASADQIIILPHLDAGQSAWTSVKWGTENQVVWEAVIRTGASIAAVTIWAGLKLTNTEAVATDDDSIYFRFDTGDTHWECVYAIADTDVETASKVTVAAATNYYLRIEIDRDRIGHFFIDNVEVGRTTALTNDVNLIPYIGVQADAAAVKTINLIKQKISRIIFESS